MKIREDNICEDRDIETNLLNNKLSKVINHHFKEKTIGKELIHILENLKKNSKLKKSKLMKCLNNIK